MFHPKKENSFHIIQDIHGIVLVLELENKTEQNRIESRVEQNRTE